MTTYAIDRSTTRDGSRDDVPLRFRVYTAVYGVLAGAGLAFLALVGVAAAA